MCIISLMYILKQSASDAVLDFVQMFVSTATLKQPEDFSKKLFFLTLMFAVFATHTVLNYILNFESTEDLINWNLSIQGESSFKELI